MNGRRNVRSRKLLLPIMHRSAIHSYEKVVIRNFERSRFARPTGEPFDLVAELDRLTNANMLACLIGLDDTDAELSERVTQLLVATMDPRVFLFKFGRRTPYGRWLRLVEGVHRDVSAVIEANRDEEPRVDALSILCHATDEDGRRLSTAEIVGELHGMLASGYLTTSVTMAWALIALAGGHAQDDLGSVIKETQRLMPTVPMSLPRPLEHRNPKVFDRPHAFEPARWATVKPTPFEFFPYGAGARRCLGASFAELQLRTTFELLLQTGVPELRTDRLRHRMTGGVVAAPRGSVLMRMHPPGTEVPDRSAVLKRFWQSLS
nr:cytochrome P450 [Kribbella antibiotica]